ncbi:hypothetical protein CCH79_00010461 [Gambusia affinis]|uniref:Potassium channel voltage dependent KCNQ C-terminal domain-containing protein n=1 Tax=Gambusia affinis TaxID=33528 RepID=A0A315V136_GAMAF|nr:hypothetical protein CCH79_00010461 [Gambusia affinis]
MVFLMHFIHVTTLCSGGRVTISVCQPPSLLSLQDQVWPRDPAPPPTPTPVGTDAVETEPTLRAQELIPQVQTQPMGMEELQVIKKELTLIKTQIDGLLDSLDRMDTQKSDHKESPLRDDSPLSLSYVVTASSPEHSLSSLSPPSSRHRIHRESPDMKMSSHSSDPEEEI